MKNLRYVTALYEDTFIFKLKKEPKIKELKYNIKIILIGSL